MVKPWKVSTTVPTTAQNASSRQCPGGLHIQRGTRRGPVLPSLTYGVCALPGADPDLPGVVIVVVPPLGVTTFFACPGAVVGRFDVAGAGLVAPPPREGKLAAGDEPRSVDGPGVTVDTGPDAATVGLLWCFEPRPVPDVPL